MSALKPYFLEDIIRSLKTVYRMADFSQNSNEFMTGFTTAISLLCTLFGISESEIME